jgi:hypothetical protein
MADESLSLHVDTDWKKQAQEEKRKLAEQEQKKAAEKAVTAPAQEGPAPRTGAGTRGGGAREMPVASFGSLVNTLMTQALFYLGDLAPQGSQPTVNLDMAKHQIDTLSILEDKTRGNLNEEEQKLLDTALYESRMRYVNVASQYI